MPTGYNALHQRLSILHNGEHNQEAGDSRALQHHTGTRQIVTQGEGGYQITRPLHDNRRRCSRHRFGHPTCQPSENIPQRSRPLSPIIPTLPEEVSSDLYNHDTSSPTVISRAEFALRRVGTGAGLLTSISQILGVSRGQTSPGGGWGSEAWRCGREQAEREGTSGRVYGLKTDGFECGSFGEWN